MLRTCKQNGTGDKKYNFCTERNLFVKRFFCKVTDVFIYVTFQIINLTIFQAIKTFLLLATAKFWFILKILTGAMTLPGF